LVEANMVHDYNMDNMDIDMNHKPLK